VGLAHTRWNSDVALLIEALKSYVTPKSNASGTSRTAMVTVHPTQGGLDVLVHNTFQNPAGSRASNSHHDFASAQ
jgi:hypothetical protein